MEAVLFCSLWKSYFFESTFFALYESCTSLHCKEVVLFFPMKVVLLCTVRKSYFFALFGSIPFLLCMGIMLLKIFFSAKILS